MEVRHIVAIIVLIVLLYYISAAAISRAFAERLETPQPGAAQQRVVATAPQAAAPQDYPLYTGTPRARAWNKPYYAMTDGERVQYIIDTYYSIEGDSADEQIQRENDYINSLPLDGTCGDDYTDCAKWAAAGECTINPEFMINHCKGSCQSCALNPQQIDDVTKIYNSRPVTQSVYHGDKYPGPWPYMKNLYSLI